MHRRLSPIIVLTSLAGLAAPSAAVAHPGHADVGPASRPAGGTYLVAADAAVPASTPATVLIEVRDGVRTITGNGLPNHPTGQFPGPGNPNAIRPQQYAFKVPADPKPATRPAAPAAQPGPRAEGPQLFGVAVNGVPFDPGTAEFWHDDRRLGWRMEAIGGPRNLGLDAAMGHVQPNGAYHYHGIPLGLIKKLTGEESPKKMVLVGWAADGFPVYGPYAYAKADDAKSEVRLMKPSYRLKTDPRPGGDEGPGGKPDGAYTRDWEYAPGTGDLDEHNGRTGVTPEFPGGTYYYVLTDGFPFIPRSFQGTPDPSFTKRGPGPGGPGRPGRPGGPPGEGGRRPPPDGGRPPRAP